ncbi:MAG: FeoA family protein [Bacteroidota bacterium]
MSFSSLDQFRRGQSGEVVAISPHQLSPKLTDMGLYPGKKVTMLFKAPFGDPIAVDVEGYTLSLRLDEAALVQMKPLKPSEHA